MRNNLVVDLVSDGVQAKYNGKYNEALKCYNMALMIDPNDFEAVYARAKIQYILNDFPASVNDYVMCAVLYTSDNVTIDINQLMNDKSFIQIALHCGHSIVAKYAREENMPAIIQLSNIYRGKLDPYYFSTNLPKRIEESEYSMFQEKCLDEGIHFIVQALKGLSERAQQRELEKNQKKQAKRRHEQSSTSKYTQSAEKVALKQEIQMNNTKKENQEMDAAELVRTLPRIEEYHKTYEMKKQARELSMQIASRQDISDLVRRFCKAYETSLNSVFIETILNHNLEVVEYAFTYRNIIILRSKDIDGLINSIYDTIENYDFNKKRELREVLDFIYKNIKW